MYGVDGIGGAVGGNAVMASLSYTASDDGGCMRGGSVVPDADKVASVVRRVERRMTGGKWWGHSGRLVVVAMAAPGRVGHQRTTFVMGCAVPERKAGLMVLLLGLEYVSDGVGAFRSRPAMCVDDRSLSLESFCNRERTFVEKARSGVRRRCSGDSVPIASVEEAIPIGGQVESNKWWVA